MTKFHSSVLEKIVWFENQNLVESTLAFDKPRRSIHLQKSSEKNQGTSGILYSKKCKKEVRYESQLELKFYVSLEASDLIKTYGSQPVRIRYEMSSYYYPDFYLQFEDNRVALGEIKKTHEMGYYKNWIKWKALKQYCLEKGFGILITDGKNFFIRNFHETSSECRI